MKSRRGEPEGAGEAHLTSEGECVCVCGESWGTKVPVDPNRPISGQI